MDRWDGMDGMNGWKDGWNGWDGMNGWLDRLDGWMKRWMDGLMDDGL